MWQGLTSQAKGVATKMFEKLSELGVKMWWEVCVSMGCGRAAHDPPNEGVICGADVQEEKGNEADLCRVRCQLRIDKWGSGADGRGVCANGGVRVC
eukprot:5614727-Amphidinium_carterae.9